MTFLAFLVGLLVVERIVRGQQSKRQRNTADLTALSRTLSDFGRGQTPAIPSPASPEVPEPDRTLGTARR